MKALITGKGWTMAGNVKRVEGFPMHPPRPLNIGVISGGWYEMGLQYGERAAEYFRLSFEFEWPHISPMGAEHVAADLHRWEQTTLVHLCPELLEMMRGIADGASRELDRSKYAKVLSHYEKVLFRHYHLELMLAHPRHEGWPPPKTTQGHDGHCRFLGAAGRATKNGHTYHIHYREGGYTGTGWSLVYTAKPKDRAFNSWFALGTGAGLVTNGGVNEKGVAVCYDGSSTEVGDEFDWGLSMSLGAVYALTRARTAAEAVDLLAHGTPEYRARTNRKTLLRGCCLYGISDPTNTRVFESACHHYAVRKPGDNGETGDYICASNNNWADYSLNDNDDRTIGEPMTRFGPLVPTRSYPIIFTIDDKKSNGYRYWTLAEWLKANCGKVDLAGLQEFSATHYYCDASGQRMDYFRDMTTGKWTSAKLSGFGLCMHQPPPETWATGTKDATIYELSKEGVKIHQAWARPCEWDGPWDVYEPFVEG